jgi:hypothetical protein
MRGDIVHGAPNSEHEPTTPKDEGPGYGAHLKPLNALSILAGAREGALFADSAEVVEQKDEVDEIVGREILGGVRCLLVPSTVSALYDCNLIISTDIMSIDGYKTILRPPVMFMSCLYLSSQQLISLCFKTAQFFCPLLAYSLLSHNQLYARISISASCPTSIFFFSLKIPL